MSSSTEVEEDAVPPLTAAKPVRRASRVIGHTSLAQPTVDDLTDEEDWSSMGAAGLRNSLRSDLPTMETLNDASTTPPNSPPPTTAPTFLTPSAHLFPIPPHYHITRYMPSHEPIYLPSIRSLISKDLSEPYSIYVYRYFLYQWGDLCFLALNASDEMVGVVISKLEEHRGGPLRGYIAMLAVREECRGKGLATRLVAESIDEMIRRGADEVVLETEVSNTTSLKLYERLGFIRSKRLHRYYLNGGTAFRLLLYLKEGTAAKKTFPPDEPPQFDDSAEGYNQTVNASR